MAVIILLIIISAVSAVSLIFFHIKVSNCKKELRLQNKRRLVLLEKSETEEFIYDIKSRKICAEGVWTGNFRESKVGDFKTIMENHIKKIPNTDFKSIFDVINKVLETEEPETLDRPMNFKGQLRWIRCVVVPYKENGKKLSHIVGAISDITDLHNKFKTDSELLQKVPGGFRRCRLTEPARLEYFNESFCNMLGYTKEEFEKATDDGKYLNVVYEEDRQKVRDHIKSLSEKEDTKTLEYRLVCKNGDIKTVSDTSQSRLESDGIMYGYCTVFDITRQVKVLEDVKEEIKKGEDREKNYKKVQAQLIQKESIYRDAIMNNCVGYMEVNFTTGNIVGDALDLRDRNNFKLIRIPELGSPMKYDEFKKWWADNMITSDRDRFLGFCNCKNMIEQYEMGYRYVALPCETKNFGGDVCDWILTYYLFKDGITGDIMGICMLNDISEQERNKREIQNLNAELEDSRIKNLISQMQPHFLYNALASIREIILVDPEYASELICDFTTHLRACVKSMSNDDLVDFEKELENIQAYINIEKMRFGDRLKVEYNIEFDDFKIVPLTIQPIVENAVRHGIYERGAKGGKVIISATKDDSNYIISIKDDGVGFDYEKIQEEVRQGKRDSTGLMNIKFRLDKIMDAKVDVESKTGSGTTVTVRIPIRKEQEVNNNEDNNS